MLTRLPGHPFHAQFDSLSPGSRKPACDLFYLCWLIKNTFVCAEDLALRPEVHLCAYEKLLDHGSGAAQRLSAFLGTDMSDYLGSMTPQPTPWEECLGSSELVDACKACYYQLLEHTNK